MGICDSPGNTRGYTQPPNQANSDIKYTQKVKVYHKCLSTPIITILNK